MGYRIDKKCCQIQKVLAGIEVWFVPIIFYALVFIIKYRKKKRK